MKFTVNDKTYFVKWEYPSNGPLVNKYTTLCKIYDVDTSYSKPLVSGHAYLSIGDRFNKNTGRKISLHRALHAGAGLFNYEARVIAWQEYFKESPKRLK